MITCFRFSSMAVKSKSEDLLFNAILSHWNVFHCFSKEVNVQLAARKKEEEKKQLIIHRHEFNNYGHMHISCLSLFERYIKHKSYYLICLFSLVFNFCFIYDTLILRKIKIADHFVSSLGSFSFDFFLNLLLIFLIEIFLSLSLSIQFH